MKTLTINVPDELDADVSAWADGESYNLNVVQTGPLTFDMVSGEPAEVEPEPVEPAEPTETAPIPPTVAALAEP